MKAPILATMVLTAAILAPPAHAALLPCGRVVIPQEIEVGERGLTLRDILSPTSCSLLLAAAEQVHLGISPPPGNLRVVEGKTVRALVEKLAAALPVEVEAWNVPERITLRRSGARESCRMIGERLLAELPRISAGDPEFTCGMTTGIPLGAPLQVIKAQWNGAGQIWEVGARCRNAGDCLPFLVGIRASAPRRQTLTLSTPPGSAGLPVATPTDIPRHGNGYLAVRRGEMVRLLWDEAGIRLEIPAQSLDGGAIGERVRARIVGSGRLFRAVVTGSGKLRVAS